MHLRKEDLENTERIKRLNIVNSIPGIKPANLIGTISRSQQTNLAIFSSVIHLGSHPALLGFICRPSKDVSRHTLDNILQTGCYTINHIHRSFIQQAHYTSAKFDRHVSEFDTCGLTPEFIDNFAAPFVKESNLKIGMQFLEAMPIKWNNTSLVIGEVRHLILPDNSIQEDGQIDLASTGAIGIAGLNSYYAIEKLAQFPYARPGETPDFPNQSS